MKTSIMRILLFVAVILVSTGVAQKSKPDTRLEKGGTCAIAATAPFGAAFIVDSRVTTKNAAGQILSQMPGCKVLLARPSILLAGVGIADTTGRAGHWNSLDVASEALKSLPEHPTVVQLDSWAASWGKTLIQHFREGGEHPRETGDVANILLMTRVEGKPYYKRTSIEWNGMLFRTRIDGPSVNPLIPSLHYAGACRAFFSVDDGEGHFRPVQYPLTLAEKGSSNYWGKIKENAKSIDDLVDAVHGLASLSTDIDTRLEGPQAVIAPPYATAKWEEGEPGWTTAFNPECSSTLKK